MFIIHNKMVAEGESICVLYTIKYGKDVNNISIYVLEYGN